MSKISIIIQREYLERVRQKSFIITTILMPVFMLALMAMPALIMYFSGTSEKQILVVDNSQRVYYQLASTPEVKFRLATPDVTLDSALRVEGVDGVLVIPENVITAKRSMLKLYSDGAMAMGTEQAITSGVNNIVEQERLKAYNIDNISQILKDVESDVTLSTLRVDKEDEQAMSSIMSYMLGLGMSFTLYMFIVIYGQMVMTSIIEEKGNRVLELIVTSVKPAQLMMGKIIGVALVAVTQIVIWGLLLSLMSGLLLPALLPADLMAEVSAAQAGQLSASAMADSDHMEMVNALSAFTQVGNVLALVGVMTLFLVLGFLIYSAIFAAVGSSVDNINDASQLTTVAIVPIILGMVLGMVAATDPLGPVAFWGSIFPLTAPMVMVARIPFGIPWWEIALSLVLLVATFIALVWMAGKIYRIGIFMYGKKPSFKEIIRWMSYK